MEVGFGFTGAVFLEQYSRREPLADEFLKDGIPHCKACKTPRGCVVELSGNKYLMPTKCECQMAVINQKQRLLDIEKHNSTVRRLRSGITEKRYREMTLASSKYPLPRAITQYIDGFENYKKKNFGLMLSGNSGSGKTYAAACIANALVEKEVSVFMVNVLFAINKMSLTFSDERARFIDSLERSSLVILDDFGVQRTNEYVNEQIYNVIETRCCTCKPLIITTNLEQADFESENINLIRTYDRIIECCHPVKMTRSSIRKEIANSRILGVEEGVFGD